MLKDTNLLWDLSKVVDKPYCCVLFQRILNAVDINIPLVEEVMKDIIGLHCGLSSLLAAKYQIYPLMQMGTHIIALQSLRNRSNYSTSLWYMISFL